MDFCVFQAKEYFKSLCTDFLSLANITAVISLEFIAVVNHIGNF